MEFDKQEIRCNNFLDVETTIEKIAAKAGEARSLKERQYCAQDILLEAKTLLSCSDYKSGDSNCINCRSVLHGYIERYEHLAKEQRQKNAINK